MQKDGDERGLGLIRSGQLLYTDDVGKDACGIGGVAAKDGKPSAEVVAKALTALKALEHRGGICGDAGDGAGLTCQIPQAFFSEEAKRLKFDQARYLKPEDRARRRRRSSSSTRTTRRSTRPRRSSTRRYRRTGPLVRLATVPTNDDALPARARDVRPAAIEQLLLRCNAPVAEVETFLYRRRLELRQKFQRSGLEVYIPSLSARLISYKGLLTSPQFVDFYADLNRDDFESGIAIFHRRYSTNTYPNWTLGQPFRYSCHNGEINTIRTNRNAVHAYCPRAEPAAARRRSAHAEDERLGLPRRVGRAPDDRTRLEPAAGAASQRPAGLGHGGRVLGPGRGGPVQLLPPDVRQPVRMGRPGRLARDRWPRASSALRGSHGPAAGAGWSADKRGWLYIASESGVFGIDAATIVASGSCSPGR